MCAGVRSGAVLGRGMQSFGGRPDIFASANIYAGAGNSSFFGAFETTIEGRRDLGSDRWDGILASGRFATYSKPATRHTVLTSLEWSGGWRQRIPFQLTLADRRRSTRLSQLVRRVVRVDRFACRDAFTGHCKQFASVGVAPSWTSLSLGG